jgi:hypothetical protein
VRRCGLSRRLARFIPYALCAAGIPCSPACQTAAPVATPAPVGPSEPTATAELIGTGEVRVALLVPKTGGGNAAATATAFRNAAALAVADFPNSGIQIAVYDTGGTAAGAQAAGRARSRRGPR